MARGAARSGTQHLRAILSHEWVARDQRELFALRLRDEQAIEGVTMQGGERAQRDRMAHAAAGAIGSPASHQMSAWVSSSSRTVRSASLGTCARGTRGRSRRRRSFKRVEDIVRQWSVECLADAPLAATASWLADHGLVHQRHEARHGFSGRGDDERVPRCGPVDQRRGV